MPRPILSKSKYRRHHLLLRMNDEELKELNEQTTILKMTKAKYIRNKVFGKGTQNESV